MTARKRRGSLKFLQPCEALPLMLAFELPTISLWNENAWRLYLFFKKKKRNFFYRFGRSTAFVKSISYKWFCLAGPLRPWMNNNVNQRRLCSSTAAAHLTPWASRHNALATAHLSTPTVVLRGQNYKQKVFNHPNPLNQKKKKSGERDTSGECLSEWARAKESKQLLFSQRCGLLFQLEGCRPNRKSTLRCEEHIPPSFIHSSFLGLFHQPSWFNSPQMGWKCLHMAWAKNQVLIMVIFAGNMNNGKYGEGITWKEGSNARRKKGRGGGGRKGGEKGRERGQERRQTCSFGRQKKSHFQKRMREK